MAIKKKSKKKNVTFLVLRDVLSMTRWFLSTLPLAFYLVGSFSDYIPFEFSYMMWLITIGLFILIGFSLAVYFIDRRVNR